MTITIDGPVRLAQAGFWVVRLHYPIKTKDGVRCSCQTAPEMTCSAIGKHPVGAQWGKGATRDAEVIADQWAYNPWNVGVLLGPAHGIPLEEAIIDIEDDTIEGRKLAEALLDDIPTVKWTSGKSIHRIFRWHPGLPQVAKITIDGLEIRIGGVGKETQSVAPPSQHANGLQYQFLQGCAPGEVEIAELPQHIVDWICEEYGRQGATGSSKAPSSADFKRFRSNTSKIREPGRNNALMQHASKCWRDAAKLHGINGLAEQDVRDQVWMWVWGANLATCEPPLDEAEVFSVFLSAEKFMTKALTEEAIERAKLQEPAPEAPLPTIEEQRTSFGAWLHAHGIRLFVDPRLDVMEESQERINEWRCDWKMGLQSKQEQTIIRLGLCGHDIEVPQALMEKPPALAQKIYELTGGAVRLDQSFSFWNWKTIWLGAKSEKGKNGITRGLREWLVNQAEVIEEHENTVASQIEDIIFSLVGGAPSQLIQAWNEYCAAARKSPPEMRLKVAAGGGLVTVRAPEDPQTGIYRLDDNFKILVKLDEVSRRFRGAYGSSVTTHDIRKALEELGFVNERVRKGELEGRWWQRGLK